MTTRDALRRVRALASDGAGRGPIADASRPRIGLPGAIAREWPARRRDGRAHPWKVERTRHAIG